MKTKFAALLLLALGILFPSEKLISCSSYKITAHGKTTMGSNYDTWLLPPVIWFETTGYGASFTGARPAGNGIAPQTGMNEYGLAFETLSAAPPSDPVSVTGKKQITDRSAFLKNILHTCKTVEEVKVYVDQYDHSFLLNEVLLYVDSSGNYLVVEPYVTTLGSEAKYVLANFCPSTISDFNTIKQTRYINGSHFRNNALDSSLAFSTAMSDTMHVCRDKIGDGTLLTSVLDLNRQMVTLYFYHDYSHKVQFNLKEELAKGDHQINLVPLFPANKEYEALVAFATPFNSEKIALVLWCCTFLFSVSALFFLISFFRSRGQEYRLVKFLLFPLSISLAFYMLVLLSNENLYYFPAPYQDYEFSILNVVAYIPFLLLLLVIPLILLIRKLFVQHAWKKPSQWLLTLNTITYCVLIVLFAYWGLYNFMA